MARTGYVYALPGHGLTYGIFKELLNGLSGTGRTKIILLEIHIWTESQKKGQVLGKMTATRIRELWSKPARIRGRTTHWTLSPVRSHGIIDKFYQQTLQWKKSNSHICPILQVSVKARLHHLQLNFTKLSD